MKNIKTTILITLLTLSLFLVVGCSSQRRMFSDFQKSDKIKIVTTTTMLKDLASQIGGDKTYVHSLMNPGVDPHTYAATKLDLDYLMAADLIITSGLHLEAQTGETIKRLTSRGLKVISVGDILIEKHNNNHEDDIYLLNLEEDNNLYDPHFWFNVKYWQVISNYITLELGKLFPNDKVYFDTQNIKYQNELTLTDEYIINKINELEESERVLITAHDAFAYFGDCYGFSVDAIQGISTESEASSKDIESLIDLVISKNVHVVFIESSVPRKTIDSLIQSAKSRNHQLVIGGELLSDSLGGPDEVGSNYIDMVKYNIDTIVDAIKKERS